MTKRSANILKVVVSFAIFGGVLWFALQPRDTKLPTIEDPRGKSLNELLAEDRKIIFEQKKASPSRTYNALVRLGQQREEKFPEAIKPLLASPGDDPLILRGIARGIGFFDDVVALDTLKNLSGHPNLDVRKEAYTGLSYKRSPARFETLLQRFQALSPSDSERLDLVRPLQKTAAGNDLAKVRSIVVDTWLEAPNNRAQIGFVISLYPNDIEVQKQLVKMLKSPSEFKAVYDLVVKALASSQNPELKKIAWKLFSETKDNRVRGNLLSNLNRLCPENRINFVQEALKEPGQGSVVQVALTQLVEMKHPETKKILGDILGQDAYPANLKSFVETSLMPRLDDGRADPCQRK